MISPQAPPCARALPAYSSINPLTGFGWPVALFGQFLLVFALVTLSGPGRIDIVDGQTRYEVARSLVDHGDSVVRDPAAWFAVYKGRDGERYSDYRIPQSALGVVAIVAADATGPVSETRRQFFFSLISPCMAALLGVLYTMWFRRLGQTPAASLAWGIGGVFCTPSWFYGTSMFDDILGTTAVVFAVAVAWLGRDRRPLLAAVVAGLALGWAFNCKPPLAVFGLAVLGALYRPELPLRRQLLPGALVALTAAVGVTFYLGYHLYKFPPGQTDLLAEYSKEHGSVTTTNPLPGLFSLALSASCGVLWYCPTLFLSWRGWRAWREQRRYFTNAVLLPSLLFVLSICFLSFFKGEPCWGPRYLTPVFALWWLFAPAGMARVSAGWGKSLLAAGVTVQLLALSVDPGRLFVQYPLPWNYYTADPWLGFNGSISHLVQRPREIVEVLTPRETPADQFNPGPLPTHAGGITTGAPTVTSLVGLLGAPNTPAALNAAIALRPVAEAQWPVQMDGAFRRYHIFNSPRPFVFNQWYLAEDARPVDLADTIALLAAAALVGFLLIPAGLRLSSFARVEIVT